MSTGSQAKTQPLFALQRSRQEQGPSATMSEITLRKASAIYHEKLQYMGGCLVTTWVLATNAIVAKVERTSSCPILWECGCHGLAGRSSPFTTSLCLVIIPTQARLRDPKSVDATYSEGSKDPNIRVLGPKYYGMNGIWALNPY